MRRVPALRLTGSDRQSLEALAATGPTRARNQARSLLLSAQHVPNDDIARTLGVSSNTVRSWRRLFERDGIEGLGTIAKGRGRKRTLSDDLVAEVVRLTLDQASAGPSGRWSTRSLAQRLGISKDSVARIWAERGIGPWHGGQPRLDHSRIFERSLVELVAFLLDPPLSTAVFSVRRAAPDEMNGPGTAASPSGHIVLTRQSPAVSRIEALLAQTTSSVRGRRGPGGGSIVRLLEQVDAAGDQADIHILVLDTADCVPAVASWVRQRPSGHWYQHPSATGPEWREAVCRWLQLADRTPPGDGAAGHLDAMTDALEAWLSAGLVGATPLTWQAGADPRLTRRPRSAPEVERATPGPSRRAAEPAESSALSSPEAVAEQLRRAILHGDLAPGEHVRQPQWAEQLGVSRTVLREAFKILSGQHLLRHDPQAGYFVAKLNVSEMRQLYRLTALVEEEILRNIRWPTRNEINVLDQQFLEHYESFLEGDLIAAIDHWRAYLFHLYSLSSETFLVKEGIRLWDIATPYRMIVLTTMLLQDPSLSEIAIARHDQITALRARDVGRFIQSIIHDRLPAFENYATHTEIMAFFRKIPAQ